MKFTSCFSNCFSSATETSIDIGREEAEGENDQNFTVFSYSELKVATHGFSASNKIGEGAFGSVYKGLLRNAGEQNRIKLGWEERRAISLGVARGLAYLHEEVEPHVVHRDIKASNILLGENLIPKVSDFGLSRILRDNVSYINTHVAGTLGYLAPEYAISGRLTRKTDVYSFGVLLLEIISGQTVVNFDLEHGEHYLVQKAWEMYRANSILQLLDPTVGMNYPEEEVIRFIKVGLLCVQETARLRPEMSTALKMLNNEIDIEGVQISQPGLVADLMNIKLGTKTTFPSLSSKASSMESSLSPNLNQHLTPGINFARTRGPIKSVDMPVRDLSFSYLGNEENRN